MVESYRLRLMFEWGGGCIWVADEITRVKYGVGPIEDSLPLSEETQQKLADMTTWHDRSLNWEYPPDPGPWDAQEYEHFEMEALAIWKRVESELGDRFSIVYERLGFYEERSSSSHPTPHSNVA